MSMNRLIYMYLCIQQQMCYNYIIMNFPQTIMHYSTISQLSYQYFGLQLYYDELIRTSNCLLINYNSVLFRNSQIVNVNQQENAL